MTLLDPLSNVSLCLELLDEKGSPCARATGFVVNTRQSPLLITNWHVVMGINPETGEAKAFPRAVTVWHHTQSSGFWQPVREPLYDQNEGKRWIEHPRGREVDLVALPLSSATSVPAVRMCPLDLGLKDHDMAVTCGEPVHVIGFPEAFAKPESLPIWKTGHIASEPEIDFDEKPMFLIDATTRGGMSGAPVVAKRVNGYCTRASGVVLGASGTRLMGVYAGRQGESSEIGRVWKIHLIDEILMGYLDPTDLYYELGHEISGEVPLGRADKLNEQLTVSQPLPDARLESLTDRIGDEEG